MIFEIEEFASQHNSTEYKGNEQRFNERLVNSRFDKMGIITNDDCVFSDGTHDVVNIDGLFSNQKLYSCLSSDNNYLYLISPFLNSTTDYVCGAIKLNNIVDFIKSNIYNDSASIIVSYDDGTIIACYNDKDIFNTNIINKLNISFQIDDFSDRLMNTETEVFEIKNGNTKYMLYKSGIGVNEESEKLGFRLVVIVPKTELIYQLSSSSEYSKALLLFISILSMICICVVIGFNANHEIKKKKSMAFDQITGLLRLPRFMHDSNVMLHKSHKKSYMCYANICNYDSLCHLHGTEYGKELILYIANSLRDFFQNKGIICYAGFDIFLLFLEVNDIDELKKLLNEFNDQIKNNSVYKNTSMSFGVKEILNSEEFNFNDTIEKAKFAEQMTDLSKTDIKVFDEELYDLAFEDETLQDCAQEAITNKEFEVFYQPKVDPKTDLIIGAEALVRWKKDGKYIPPGKFIPLFEQNGFVTKIDLFVFEEACKFLREQTDNGLPTIPISTNLSKKHFVNLDFVVNFKEIVEKYNIPHNLINVEITEGLIIENMSLFKDFIKHLHNEGYCCSMDDFGSGYSSFNVIRELDFDDIKIDSKFFRGENGFDGESQTIVEAIIDLCHKLNKKVVAEGIEEKEQVEFLKKCNCDSIQGYFYSKPVPKNEFIEMLKNNIK
ncbi:MAG: EAL domain-containing protein [Anaeroplasma sp.]